MILTEKNKKGGGVAIYVLKDYFCEITESLVLDDVMESLTIRIKIDKEESIFLCCIYKAPGAHAEHFINCLPKVFGNFSKKKSVFVCGDFNIDLLKWKTHKLTFDFINEMFSYGLRPVIDKPTRVTQECATLIDNIFTNIQNKWYIAE